MGPINEKPMNMQTIARPPAPCLYLEAKPEETRVHACIGVEFSRNRNCIERDRSVDACGVVDRVRIMVAI